jgi:hypothetical protein
MKAVFIELPAFERHRKDYLDDDAFSRLQEALMGNPEAGDLIEGTGGLRKVRFGDARRGWNCPGLVDGWLSQNLSVRRTLSS